MRLITYLIVASVSLSLFIYSSIYIPEGVEDRCNLYPVAIVSKILDCVYYILFQIGVNDLFILTRVLATATQFIAPVPEGVEVDEVYLDGLRAKILRPAHSSRNSTLPAFIYIHGGGLTLGSPEQYSYVTGYLAKEVGMVVVAVTYRLAPEHLYPAQSDDVLKATEYFLEHCSEWGVDPSKIFMGGDSVGGWLTAVTTIRLIRKNSTRLRAIVLIYPPLQMVTSVTPSYIRNADNFLVSRSAGIMYGLVHNIGRSQELFAALKVLNVTSSVLRKEIADKYNLPELANRGPPHMDEGGDPHLISRFQDSYLHEHNSPLLTSVIDQFPPTLFVACEFDILRDDSAMMARRLERSGVPVEYHFYNSIHGMISFAPQYKPAGAALRGIAQFVNTWKH